MKPSLSSGRSDTGSSVFYIDLTGVGTPGEFQARLVKELPLPSYYGSNLDALYDVLTEYGSGWNLIFCRAARLKRSQPRYFAALERLCSEASEETPGLTVRFFMS